MKKPYTFEIYKSKNGFRWRLKTSNGKIIADSAEAYNRKAALLRVIDNMVNIHFKIKEI